MDIELRLAHQQESCPMCARSIEVGQVVIEVHGQETCASICAQELLDALNFTSLTKMVSDKNWYGIGGR